MTSKPASRNDAATTLAPRSCPSRPALATSTRIFLSKSTPSLELRRLVVLAEHDAHRLSHLALGGVGAGAVDQERHQVLLLVARRLGQGREPARDQVVVARLAHLLKCRHLIALDLLIDVQDRNLDLLV